MLFYQKTCNVISPPFTSALFFFFLLFTAPLRAENFEANFKNTDIGEFINTVSRNLNKTIILDPTVKGNVSVRSDEKLSADQYYQFFLSVLEVYGFAVIPMDNNLLKVIPAKNAKSSPLPLVSASGARAGDALVSRVVPLRHVTAKDLAPLLRQLNDMGAGSVVHYDPTNVILMTGRAAVIDHLAAIIESVDRAPDDAVERVVLENASAPQVAELLNNLAEDRPGAPASAKAVADSRTNTLLISGQSASRDTLSRAARALDSKNSQRSSAKVIYLKHAKAENLLEVLTGIDTQVGDQPAASRAQAAVTMQKEVVVKADKHTNALVINAPPDVLNEMESIIHQLDIDRAQVLVEAIIVELQDAEAQALGIQWFNTESGGTFFPGAGSSVIGLTTGTLGQALAKTNGLAAGFYRGNWAGLFTALQTHSRNNILATPSIVTLDNVEAEFNVGQDVPVLTGSQSASGNSILQSVSRRTVGIKLKVKPQINTGDAVLMDIEQEVSSVQEESNNNSLGPTFNTRTVRNSVRVGSGETVVVGGLLDNSRSSGRNSVPLLGKIPLIGALFRASTDKDSKRNLMLFIRPTVIRSERDFRATTRLQHSKLSADVGHSVPQLSAQDEPASMRTAVEGMADVLFSRQRNHDAVQETTRLIDNFYQDRGR
ncbi:type II secretion system secretin GspD [Pantoea eucrina]|uniref:Type II secretion system secretin GspD n=1 Tax=Pantoea eucrina TaxID=472693 RepID=A0ABU5LC82_9GAMM|nr:type II secretion system secretin GspD [Pantoea eucrina]MDZ7277558.1 type II secretion system secretin GspD [Pantoea eucrina]